MSKKAKVPFNIKDTYFTKIPIHFLHTYSPTHKLTYQHVLTQTHTHTHSGFLVSGIKRMKTFIIAKLKKSKIIFWRLFSSKLMVIIYEKKNI